MSEQKSRTLELDEGIEESSLPSRSAHHQKKRKKKASHKLLTIPFPRILFVAFFLIVVGVLISSQFLF
ncbi:hypothetical protein [Shouchella shacheensis]|uniref:hypothetical protein n=1 Tax=Shouchella shacheensis TaxID=1649580 RepID=UPI00073FFEAE|nr:hypothetical protein [Shouchella shacheensis]